MSKKEETREILSSLKIPGAKRSNICCYSLLAMASVTEASEWTDATNEWLRIHDVMRFIETAYGVYYAESSRETSKEAMHHFRNAAIAENNGKATNNYRYRITCEFLRLLKKYGGPDWQSGLEEFFTFRRKKRNLHSLAWERETELWTPESVDKT
jgi:hypothetical protein